jgi:hypothetical protein
VRSYEMLAEQAEQSEGKAAADHGKPSRRAS